MNTLGSYLRGLYLIVVLSLGLACHGATGYAQTEASAPAVTAASQPAEAATNVTLDFKDADINTVLRVISLKSKINIVAGPEVKGTVTIRLEDVPWERALDVILRTYDYVYERDNNIIRVTTREKMEQEPVITQTYVLNYTTASEVMNAVKDMLTERGRIKTAERTNMVIITDIPTNLYRVGEVLKKLDKITPQAFIDSKIIKTDVGLTENLGIEWKTGGSGNAGSVSGASRPVTFPFATSPENDTEYINDFFRQFFPINAAGTTTQRNDFDYRNFPLPKLTDPANGQFQFGTLNFSSFSAVLQMLKSRSNTKVVSNPRIVVLNNQTAKVQVGEQIPLPSFERNENTGSVEITGFTYRDVGVVLNVTPHINSEEEILVDLRPEVSAERATNVDYGDFQVPAFTVTTAQTQVLIQSGQTIAIGGLLTDSVSITEAKVPYLSKIPFAGKLFRSKRQSAGSGNAKVETLFFITVTMVDTEGQPSGARAKRQYLQGQSIPTPPASSGNDAASKAPDAVPEATGNGDPSPDSVADAVSAPSPDAPTPIDREPGAA